MKNTVTLDKINNILAQSEFRVGTVFDKCTVLHVKLPNGFILSAESSCVDPANYNQEVGKAICEKKIVDKLWELEGYCLQNELHESKSETCDESDIESN